MSFYNETVEEWEILTIDYILQEVGEIVSGRNVFGRRTKRTMFLVQCTV